MKFAERFPNPYLMQEVLEKLVYNAEEAACVRCGDPTRFLDYTLPKPAPICSEECLIKLAEQQTGKLLGAPEDYRLLEAPK